MNTSNVIKSKKSPFMLILIIVAALLGGGFMGKLMFDMVNYMKMMTIAVVAMSQNVNQMSADMSIMREKFVNMASMVDRMGGVLKDVETNMIDMNASVMGMDNNMKEMEGQIKNIQHAMAEDMSGIRKGVERMSIDVQRMSGDVFGMNRQMGLMVHDIHRGQTSFTSPINYMRNFMAPSGTP
jgi:hypothetical protein